VAAASIGRDGLARERGLVNLVAKGTVVGIWGCVDHDHRYGDARKQRILLV
jgi:hypothetical protein